jgi:uncharacterized protein involved in exopolysaccharide biosynthesis
LVSAQTALVNAARELAKSYGERLPKCGTEQVSRELAAELSLELREVLESLLKEVESLNERIKEYDVGAGTPDRASRRCTSGRKETAI